MPVVVRSKAAFYTPGLCWFCKNKYGKGETATTSSFVPGLPKGGLIVVCGHCCDQHNEARNGGLGDNEVLKYCSHEDYMSGNRHFSLVRCRIGLQWVWAKRWHSGKKKRG